MATARSLSDETFGLRTDDVGEWTTVERVLVEAEPFATWLVRDGVIVRANSAASVLLGAPIPSGRRGRRN